MFVPAFSFVFSVRSPFSGWLIFVEHGHEVFLLKLCEGEWLEVPSKWLWSVVFGSNHSLLWWVLCHNKPHFCLQGMCNAGRDGKGGKGVQYLNRLDRWLTTLVTIGGNQEGVLKRHRKSWWIMHKSRNDRCFYPLFSTMVFLFWNKEDENCNVNLFNPGIADLCRFGACGWIMFLSATRNKSILGDGQHCCIL